MRGTYQSIMISTLRHLIEQHDEGLITDKGLAKHIIEYWRSVEQMDAIRQPRRRRRRQRTAGKGNGR